MSMTIQEAIKRINEHMSIHHIGQYPHIHLAEAMQMALDALREKAEREDPPIKIVIPAGIDEKRLIEMLHNAPVQILPCEPVQEGKPLEAFLHPIDNYKGLKAKYLVFKADTGAKVDNCFILRPDKDPAAVEAIRAYASATDNETLAEDIYNWVGKGEPVQEWISVKDKWPEQNGIYLTCNKKRQYEFHMFQTGKSVWQGIWVGDGVTHWMPLPQPPKGGA